MKIIFAGTPEFAVPALEALVKSPHQIIGVYTQPDRPAGRGRQLQESPVKQFAALHSLSVFQPNTLKDMEAQQIFKNLEPDIMIVAAYGLILPKIILNTPTYGCINIHASLLPRFRGASPIQAALLAGDKETGITIMQMEEGLDTGPILCQSKCLIENLDNVHSLEKKLSLIGSETLMSALDNIHHFTPIKQNNANATYAPKINKSETILNFNESSIQCVRKVKAFYPAQFFLNNQSIKVWEAESVDNPIPNECIKKITQASKHGIDIGTSNGIFRILKLQLPGGKILSAQEVLNSRAHMFAVGTEI